MITSQQTLPESDAVSSSGDERPWPTSTTFAHAPLRDTPLSGLSGGIWGQQRGSFKMTDSAKRNAVMEVRRAAGAHSLGGSALSTGDGTPTSAGAGSLPFAIPLHAHLKTGRSLSHSQGQRELPMMNNHSAQGNSTASGGQPAALTLALLSEEADTDSESESGHRLTHTLSHPPIGSLARTNTLPTPGAGLNVDNRHVLMEKRSMQAEGHDSGSNDMTDHHLASSLAGLAFDPQPARRAQWQSSLGWDHVRNPNESRRHSLAEIPTRRGSLAGAEPGFFGRPYSEDPFEADDAIHNITGAPRNFAGQHADRNMNVPGESIGMTLSQNGNYEIPLNYRVPLVDLNERERNEINSIREQQAAAGAMSAWGMNNNSNRPRKQLFIVSFKCSRVDVFYLLENTGLTVREGDLVIVEADRGQDLGTVQHANVSPEVARLYKKKYSEEQYKWLMMYSHNKEGANNPNADLQRDNSERQYYATDAPSSIQGHPNFARDSIANLKPKAIKRLAQQHEIKMLADKEGNEAKAKRTCQQKVAHLHLQMEILDAEWQWDFQKLIFYYYADHYINFKDLITELYRIYKTRIWLSAINPASFSQHAISQPPSGIGPGAVTPFDPQGLNNAYTMAYGEDRDPYGAQMPYRIGYDTYTPNFPSIPGVPNSYAPGSNPYATGLSQGGGSSLATMTGNGSASGPQLQQQHQHQQQLQLQQQQLQLQNQLQNQQRQLQLQQQQQAQSQHYESSATSMNDQAAVRQAYNWYGTPGSAPGAHQHQPHFGPTMPSSPPTVGDSSTRPNYSFGPRLQTNSPASPMNARANTWDRPGSSSLSMQRPSLPSPIGTRPAAGTDGVGVGHRPLSGAAMTGAAAGTKGRRW